MPSTCCVPGCKSNYANSNKASVFKFPDDPILKARWSRAIPRKEFLPTKSSRVCELHFLSTEVIRISEMYDSKSGKKFSAPLKYPRLADNSIPSIFPNCPSYMSKNAYKMRESVDEKKERLENEALETALKQSLKEKEAYDAKMNFLTLEELSNKFSKIHLSEREDWTVFRKCNQIIFSLVEMKPAPFITSSVVIDEALNLTVYIKGVLIKTLKPNFEVPTKVNNINVLQSILENVIKNNNSYDSVLIRFQSIKEILYDIAKDPGEVSLNVVKFIQEQINLLCFRKESRRYSTEMLIFSSLLYSISAHAYRFMLSSDNVILPHPSTLRRLCSEYSLNPKLEQYESGFLLYMSTKFSLLNNSDTKIILMMDEIHIKPFFEFKGGSILGVCHNSISPATTAYVFMVQSMLSTYKDVVHILPVAKITAEDLFIILKKIICKLEEIGFMVIAVVSDNNAINSKAISFFASPPTVSIVYTHPMDNSRPLFFVIDSVHILKSVRNNWLNRKPLQCFYFPDFDACNSEADNFKVLTASFSALKYLHQIENSEPLMKYGYGLSLKCLNPSNLERQNVALALKIFNRILAAGLRELGAKHNILDYEDTAKFIEMICTWFEICNVKTPYKGKRLRNKFQEPLTIKDTDDRYLFLQKILNWLDIWKAMGNINGTLTKETHFAFQHTTHSLIEIASYCINELKFDYILPGKIQTDLLEERFGQYRKLSGSQYHIAITQVYESEKKLRMQDFLPLTLQSESFGKITITTFDEENENYAESGGGNDIRAFQSIEVSEKDLTAITVLPVLTYLGGYCVYRFLKDIKCEFCRQNLTLDKEIDIDISYHFLANIDRGGLLFPHPDIVLIVLYNYIVVKQLVSKKYEETFLKAHNQRSIVNKLSFDIIMNAECISYDQCLKGHSLECIVKFILKTSTNTFLKNYCLQKNDIMKKCSKKRKLQTLVKETVPLKV